MNPHLKGIVALCFWAVFPKATSDRVFDHSWLTDVTDQRAEAQGQRVICWTTRWGVGDKAIKRTLENTAHSLRQPVPWRREYGHPCYIRRKTLSEGFLSDFCLRVWRSWDYLRRDGVVIRRLLLVLSIISRSICIAIYQSLFLWTSKRKIITSQRWKNVPLPGPK